MRVVGRAGIGVVAFGAVALLTAGAGAAGLLQTGGASDEELLDRLIAVERQLPTLPPDQVLLAEDETWADVTGDFTGAKVALDQVADETRDLFVTADDGASPVATAVADVARGLLVLRQGYELLAAWESHDLAFPLGSRDDDDVATGADQIYGAAQTGLTLVLDAHQRLLPAYEILRDAEAADADEKAFFDGRYREAQSFHNSTRADLHRALSYDTTQVLRTVSRFVTTAPGIEPRARVLRVVCIAREAYVSGEIAAVDLPEELAALSSDPAEDCPAVENGNEVRLIER